MKRVLITGMSGTGKSSVTAVLAARGYTAVDADSPDFSAMISVAPEEVTGLGQGTDWVWQEERIDALLNRTDTDRLFVSGCSPNQGVFYPRFDHIVLLSAPVPVIINRLATRTTNDFGKDPDQLQRTLQLQQTIEPMLRRSADLEVDTTASLDDVVTTIVESTS